MNGQDLPEQVGRLRDEGESIGNIAAKLGVQRSRVYREA